MSDAVSVSTKASRAPVRSSLTSRQKQLTKADWRAVVRDGYATLFDMVGDWAYLYAIYHRDYDGDGNADTYTLPIAFDYNTIIRVVFGFCIISTILSLWTILTSLRRKCGKYSMCCNCTVPRLALAGILFEDLPQFILTAYIDYSFSGGLTSVGMMNICSSFNGLIIRATTRYDEIVEEDGEDDASKLGTVYEAMP